MPNRERDFREKAYLDAVEERWLNGDDRDMPSIPVDDEDEE